MARGQHPRHLALPLRLLRPLVQVPPRGSQVAGRGSGGSPRTVGPGQEDRASTTTTAASAAAFRLARKSPPTVEARKSWSFSPGSIPHLCALSCICYTFQPLNFQFPSTPLRTRSPTPLADPSSRLRLRRQARTFPLDTRTIAARESPPCLLPRRSPPPPHLRLPPSRPPPVASAFLIQILLRLCSTHRTEARYKECL